VVAIEPTTDSPIFVVGFPRSGTTLVHYLLNDHPEQAVATETHFLDRFVPKYRDRNFRNWTDLTAFWTEFTDGLANKFWAEFTNSEWFQRLGPVRNRRRGDYDPSFPTFFTALLSAYAVSTGKSRIGEKTPDHYEHLATLLSWFPEARIIFLLRDPRAVIASYLRVRRPWAQGVNAYTLSERWQSHLSHLYRWRDDPRVRVVRYESLVRDPETELGGILNFAGLSDETTTILARRPVERFATGSFVANAPVSDANVEAWRTRLSPRQIATAEGVLGPDMVNLDYALDHPRIYSRGVAQITRAGQKVHQLLGGIRSGAT
jgi:hypothetical protein